MPEPKPQILIIDDSSFNRNLISSVLLEVDYRVIEAPDAEKGLALASEESPDLILLDVTMPAMDGYEACERLKKSEETKDLPVVFLSNRSKKEEIIKGFECGAVDYITTPFCREELLSRVRTHIDLSRSRKAIAAMKDDYQQLLQMVCHDLLNPLSHIRYIFEAEKDHPDLLITMKEEIREAVENGIGIIEIVRKMRRVSDAGERLDLDAVDLAAVAGDLSHMLQERFREKGIELTIDIEKGVHVIAERTSLLNSVLNNLLTNALKFSNPASTVVLGAREVGGQIHITVKDSGIGMSERLIEDLFKMNAVTTREGTTGEKGTGYGMRLVKRFVDAYGGSIEVSSKVQEEGVNDHGTSVTVKLEKADPV
ncbi:MAG: hybrid sensor histidine kinase/response regulator [Proteobacteria bacterium]|nr:hybrid sensor histidine kinase/response regulator [Pseudomonadota bacterium]